MVNGSWSRVRTVRRLAIPLVGSIDLHVSCSYAVRQVIAVRRPGGPTRRTVRQLKSVHDLKCTRSGAHRGREVGASDLALS